MRLRASGDMVRAPRLAVPRAVLLALVGESELLVSVASLPPRLDAQYLFMRSLTAFRSAADIVRRRPRRGGRRADAAAVSAF